MKLTKTNIDKSTEGDVIRDHITPGLEARHLKTGVFFYLRKTDAYGKQRRVSLGQYGALTIEQAREAATDAIQALNKGLEPKATIASGRTMTDLYNAWKADHAPELKPSTVQTMTNLWKADILPLIGKRDVKSISRDDVIAVRNSISSIYQANRAVALLSKCFNLAELWGWRDLNTNPCTHIKRHKEKQRVAYLADEDFATLIQSLDFYIELGTEYQQRSCKAIKCIAFTGARRNEILQAKWAWFDAGHGVLNLPDSKTGEKVITLPELVQDILASIPQESDYIFESTTKPGTPIYDVKYAWKSVKEHAGIEYDLRIHDLRHNYASRLASMGVGLHQIGELLGHTQASTTKRYAHFMQEERRSVASLVAESMGEETKIKRLKTL